LVQKQTKKTPQKDSSEPVEMYSSKQYIEKHSAFDHLWASAQSIDQYYNNAYTDVWVTFVSYIYSNLSKLYMEYTVHSIVFSFKNLVLKYLQVITSIQTFNFNLIQRFPLHAGKTPFLH